MGKTLVLMLLTGTLAIGLALAQPGPGARRGAGGGAGFGPCSDDVKRLCGDVKAGQGRVYRCMHEKESEVSAACKDHLQQRRAEFREERKACHDDVLKFCKGIRPGQGRVAACLKSHEAELSPACKQEFPPQ